MAQELHPGCNLVLGYNGSGKSNFLQAIIFALSDLHSKKTKSQGKEYSVEVILDNTKQKIPVAGNEIIVKKTYNCDLDKDTYFLNGSHIQERELFNLFESGGFSLSGQSQFQIVQQGQVEQLVLQGEEGFLKMLREVTGTESFDSRVEKMNSVLQECQTKKEQLEKILEAIKGRLDQLGQEIEEYREIQKIEKEKKTLEYALYMTKLQKNNQEIDKLRRERVRIMDDRQTIINQREEFIIENSNQKDAIDSLKNEIQLLEVKLQNLNSLRTEIMSSKTTAEHQISQRQDQKTLYDYFSTNYDQQLKQLTQGIALIQKEIQELTHQQNQIEQETSKLKQKRAEIVREKDLLLMKKETMERFQNPQQRKKFYQEELDKIKVQLALITKDKDDALKGIEAHKKKVNEINSKIQGKIQDSESLKNKIKESEKEMEAVRDDKRKIAGQLKNMMFQQGEVELEIKAMKTKYTSEVDNLEKLDPIYSTIKRLKALIIEKRIAGFRGLLIDFIEVDSKFTACVDLAAKSKLFSIIVDDLDTAKEILTLNQQIKGGVINIYPLSVLGDQQDKPRNYPASGDVMPLFKLLKLNDDADPRLAKLIYNVFSKVLLVKTYSYAMEIARDYNLTCITPDLQIVYAGAFITRVGQYNKSQLDRVAIYRKVKHIQSQVELKLAELIEFENQRDKLNEKDLEAMRRIQKVEVQLNGLKSSYQQQSTLQFDLNQQLEHKHQQIKDLQKQLEYLEHQENEAQGQIKDLDNESQQLAQQFDQKDQNRLIFINKTLDELNRQLQEKESERNNINNHLQQSTNLLNDNYLKRQKDIRNRMLEQDIDAKIIDKDEYDQNTSASGRDLAQVEAEMQSIKDQYRNKTEKLDQLIESLEFTGQNEQLTVELRQKTVEIEELSMKIDEIQGRNNELEQQMRKLEIYDKQQYQNAIQEQNQQRLIQEIQLRARELEKFPRMNRHCVEWFDKYSTKHNELKKKFDDQIETEQGILKLLQDLDAQKQQALERNFLKLNENFYEIFSRIVPQGKAEMRLIKKEREDESQISHPSQFQEPSQVMKIGQQVYKGIKVRVSFSGQNNQLEGLGHLSGGQKAVVAASLLFAILKIEAAPFYIMDEFDNALDAEFRGAIAGLIIELAQQSQFLITTFKPELVENADKIFQVKTKNNVSEIRQIDQNKAYEIINENDK